ncbi:hypothetical protein [Bradyrhizobium sp. RDT46]|uniref:hypothetical protein n=1 Tax=Bradyrhizobium sp. RDT46 TaxID=3341829 RepID=UPI0035C77EE7
MNEGITRRRRAHRKSSVGRAKSSLAWWRSMAAPDFGPAAIDAMRGTIAKIAMLHERRWRDAVAGDATSAFEIALSMDPAGPCHSRLDLAMTALVICAYEGSPAACVVVASVLSRLPRLRGKEDLADSWALRASAVLAGRPAPD